LELEFVRTSRDGFSVRPSRERAVALTAETAPGGAELMFTVTRADGPGEPFTLATDAGEDGDPVIGRGGDVSVRRMPNGNLEMCLWLTLGTVFWPYCFYRYD
jgi:hypothetical protein